MARTKLTATDTPSPSEPAAEWVAVASLKPWGKNPRKNDKAVAKVAESILAFGFGAPIIAGHTRLKAAEKLGMTSVPVRYLDLDEAKAHALALADNKIGELADWDEALLAAALADIRGASGVDLSATGFADRELKSLLESHAALSSGDDDAELGTGTADSQPGRIYELGPHRLFVGDSTPAMDLGEGAKLQIADPPFDVPYGQWHVLPTVDVVGVWFRSKDALTWILSECGGPEWGMHMLAFTGGVRGQHNHTLPCCMHENVMVLRRTWWKDKMDAIDREVIRASGCKATTAPDSRPISWQEQSGGVATANAIGMSWAKPIMQMEMLTAYVPRGALVWDPCAGSGSSLIAAAKHGRLWRGCEMDPLHADLIRRRWTKMALANGLDPGPGALDSDG